MIRSRHQSVLEGKVFVKVFAKFTGKHLYQGLLFACNLIKKDNQAQVFPLNFAKIFIKHLSLQNTSGGCFYIIENAKKKLHAFFISNTFVSNSKLKKIKQNLSNTLRLNFCYLNIISSLHVRYHSKIGLIMCNKKCVSVFKFNDKRK